MALNPRLTAPNTAVIAPAAHMPYSYMQDEAIPTSLGEPGMTLLEGIGRRIRKRREDLSLKQADVASALQLSAQAVSKWERGENAPDIAILAQLCRILGVSVDWLLGLHEESRDVFEATVFVSGVQGFAKKAMAMPPAEVASWANGIFYHLTEAALKHSGVPVKQMGDGMLCFFSGDGHRDRAVASARLAIASQEKITVALASGEIYLGALGHPDYKQPDIMGSTVNVAFLLLGSVAPGKSAVVATADVARKTGEGASFAGPFQRELSLLGKKVEVYELTAK